MPSEFRSSSFKSNSFCISKNAFWAIGNFKGMPQCTETSGMLFKITGLCFSFKSILLKFPSMYAKDSVITSILLIKQSLTLNLCSLKFSDTFALSQNLQYIQWNGASVAVLFKWTLLIVLLLEIAKIDKRLIKVLVFRR